MFFTWSKQWPTLNKEGASIFLGQGAYFSPRPALGLVAVIVEAAACGLRWLNLGRSL